MSNLKTLKPFVKGDPRINRTGLNAGHFSMTKAVKEFLLEKHKDGKTYGKKLSEAAVIRAIVKSDTLAKEIWDRTDGKIPQGVEMGGKDGAAIQFEEKISDDAAEKLGKKYEAELRKVISETKEKK